MLYYCDIDHFWVLEEPSLQPTSLLNNLKEGKLNSL